MSSMDHIHVINYLVILSMVVRQLDFDHNTSMQVNKQLKMRQGMNPFNDLHLLLHNIMEQTKINMKTQIV